MKRIKVPSTVEPEEVDSRCPSQGRSILWGEHNTHVPSRGLYLFTKKIEDGNDEKSNGKGRRDQEKVYLLCGWLILKLDVDADTS